MALSIIDELAADEEMEPEVKRFIFEYAESILRASNLVHVRGAAALLDERDRIVGALQRNVQVLRGASENSPMQKLFEVLTKIKIALTLVSTPPAIAADTLTVI